MDTIREAYRKLQGENEGVAIDSLLALDSERVEVMARLDELIGGGEEVGTGTSPNLTDKPLE